MTDPTSVDRVEFLKAFRDLGIDLTDVRYLTGDASRLVLHRSYRDHEGRIVHDGTGIPLTIQSSVYISPAPDADAP